MSKIIELNALDLVYCAVIADRRNWHKEMAGVPSGRVDPHASTYGIHLAGVMGEWAVARELRIQLNEDALPGGDGNVEDLIYPDPDKDIRIQVKTNMARAPMLYLYFNDVADFQADVAVLVAVESLTNIRIVGWITSDVFLRKARELDFGYGPRWGVPETDLVDIRCFRFQMEARS